MPNSGLERSSDLAIVVRRFAAQELAVRRLYASDPDFRTVCEDLAAAIRAAQSWAADARRVEDYRVLVDEFEAEIRDKLSATATRTQPPHDGDRR